MRARARLFLHNFEEQLFAHIPAIESGNQKAADAARAAIRDNLTQIVPLFAKQEYILGDEFSMLDVALAPLLWRLGHYGIDLPKQAAPLLKYAERIFSRPAYIEAMTPSEKAMRK
jgi:RNA polymerase-associated protein